MPDLKTLFDTPKKARTAILCGLVALATLAAVIVYAVRAPGSRPEADAPPAQSQAVSAAPSDSPGPDPSPTPTQSLTGIVPALTIDQARELALAEAGVSEDQAEVSREALTQDNGLWVYEFRFRTAQAQYEYKLNANTGEVRSMVKEVFVYPSAQPTDPVMPTLPAASVPPTAAIPQSAASAPPATVAPSAQPSAPDVGLEKAKTAALADAGVSAGQAAFTKAERDYEDGRLVYDIEFYTATHEYEYEVAADTGAICSRSAEAFQTSPPSAGPSGVYIGADQAKSTALEHAGLTASQVTFTHVSMDRDHGQMVYEVEFRQGRVEYEYKIDASTGRILDHEKDMD